MKEISHFVFSSLINLEKKWDIFHSNSFAHDNRTKHKIENPSFSTIASPKLLNDLFDQKTKIITTTFHLLKQLFFLTKTLHIWAKLCLILYSQNLKLLNQYCHNLREVVHQSRGCSLADSGFF